MSPDDNITDTIKELLKSQESATDLETYRLKMELLTLKKKQELDAAIKKSVEGDKLCEIRKHSKMSLEEFGFFLEELGKIPQIMEMLRVKAKVRFKTTRVYILYDMNRKIYGMFLNEALARYFVEKIGNVHIEDYPLCDHVEPVEMSIFNYNLITDTITVVRKFLAFNIEEFQYCPILWGNLKEGTTFNKEYLESITIVHESRYIDGYIYNLKNSIKVFEFVLDGGMYRVKTRSTQITESSDSGNTIEDSR